MITCLPLSAKRVASATNACPREVGFVDAYYLGAPVQTGKYFSRILHRFRLHALFGVGNDFVARIAVVQNRLEYLHPFARDAWRGAGGASALHFSPKTSGRRWPQSNPDCLRQNP